MFKHRLAMLFVALAAAALTAGSTMAAGNPAPSKPVKQTTTQATTPSKPTNGSPGGAPVPGTGTTSGVTAPTTQTCNSQRLPNGLVIHAWVQSQVADGQPAKFTLSVSNTSCQTLRFATMALYWGYDNGPLMSSITWNANGAYSFNDGARNWLVLNQLDPGKGFTLKGTITVPNRANKKTYNPAAHTVYVEGLVQTYSPATGETHTIGGNKAYGFYAVG